MSTLPLSDSRPHLRGYLTAGYVLFIIYVSLTPFNWQDQGLSFYDVLSAPLAQTFTGFDFVLNLTSYLLLGLLTGTLLHHRMPDHRMLFGSTLCGLLLSAGLEYLQMYLPGRVSSNTDLLSNMLGALSGSVITALIYRNAWNAKFHELHNHLFKHGSLYDFGLALLALWLFAQTNPSLPMLGSVFIREVARWPFDIVPATPFSWLESAEVASNLVLLGILLSTLLRIRKHTPGVLVLLLGIVTLIKFVAAILLLKSWALLIWLDSEALSGIIAGIILLLFLLHLSQKGILIAGAATALAYLALVQDLLTDSRIATVRRLFHWHYIHLLNYNGFSQIAIQLFPLLMLLYLWRTGAQRK